jgi:phosphoglycolate phosphatase
VASEALGSGRTRLVVFDLDGTLVDSRRDIAESANDLLVECGAQPLSEEAIGTMVGDGAATLIARAFAAAGCPPPADALGRFLDIYDRRLLRHTRVYDGIPALLETLSATLATAVLTNKPIGSTLAILDGLELTRFFRGGVLGGDGPHPRKPDPAGLLQLMQTAGASPGETLMVGDSGADWQAARAASTRSCLARYGFGFHSVPIALLTPDDSIIDRPLDVVDYL